MSPGSDKVIPFVNFLSAILKKVAKEPLTAAKSSPFLLNTNVLAGAPVDVLSSLATNESAPVVDVYSHIDWSPFAARMLSSPVKVTAVMILLYGALDGTGALPVSSAPCCADCTLIAFHPDLVKQTTQPSPLPAATRPSHLTPP